VGAPVTFLLLHGGGMSGAFWDRLVPHLASPALALDMPGRAGKPADPMELTVAECVASLAADVEAAGIEGDCILVAHSSGGLFTPGLAAAVDSPARRVRHIVLDAASVPPEGGCGLDSMKAKHRDGVLQGMEAARRDGWALTTPGPEPREKVRTAYGGDPLPDELVEFVVDPRVCVRDSMNIYFQPVSWAVVGDVPITFVKHLRDRPSPPEFQDELVGRLRAMGRDPEIVEIDSGHIPAVTHPEELARILNRIADRLGAEPVAHEHRRNP
jgi:pimeloyl-ACP methyl ester carboxylesterase